MEKVTVYGLNGQAWKRRRSFTIEEYNWNRLEIIKPFNEKFKIPHAVFPAGINPNDASNITVIFTMLQKVESFGKSYKSDFYLHDTITFYELGRKVIWLVRDAGTNMFAAKEFENEYHKAVTLSDFKYYMQQERGRGRPYHLYLINDTEVKKITWEKALLLLENTKVKEPQTR